MRLQLRRNFIFTPYNLPEINVDTTPLHHESTYWPTDNEEYNK